MSELMESLEARRLLSGNPWDAPELPAVFENVRITLLQEEAPRAVRSFLELRDQGKLRDVIMHRAMPSAKSMRAGLFRETPEGLEYAPKTKRIDEGRSLPTVRGTVGFMRDPDDPGRTTGEIVFNTRNRPGVRPHMVVFGTFSTVENASLFFDLRDQVDVEQSHLLRSVPAKSGSTFEDIEFLDFGTGNLGGSDVDNRLGGFASANTAEWITLKNDGSSIEKFEIQFRTSRDEAIVARWFVRPGQRRLVQMHIGENLADVDRREFFGVTQGDVVVASGVVPGRDYAAIVHSGGLDVMLQRLERDPDSGVVRPYRIEGAQHVSSSIEFPPIDLSNGRASTRLDFLNQFTSEDLRVRISATTDQNERIVFYRKIFEGDAYSVTLDAFAELEGRIARVRVERISGPFNGLVQLVDGAEDFAPRARGIQIAPGLSVTNFFQRGLEEGTPLRFLVFNPNQWDVTVTAEVSLVLCSDPDDCPVDPPEVPRLEPFEVPAGGFAWFPVEGEAPEFDQDFIFRMISRRSGLSNLLAVHLYFDPAMLGEL